jgi:hypothetical protein
LNDLPQTQDGGFVLKPGFYETELKLIACSRELQIQDKVMRICKAQLQVTGKRS